MVQSVGRSDYGRATRMSARGLPCPKSNYLALRGNHQQMLPRLRLILLAAESPPSAKLRASQSLKLPHLQNHRKQRRQVRQGPKFARKMNPLAALELVVAVHSLAGEWGISTAVGEAEELRALSRSNAS